MNYPCSFIQYCADLGLKLTSSRRAVLYTLWQAKKPLKAYEILDNLLKINLNSKPTTIYRALIFLATHGIVHKIESIQSYTLCCEPEKHWLSEVLMVCNTCHQVIEIHDIMIQTFTRKLADDHYFKLSQDVIELKGICQHCSL